MRSSLAATLNRSLFLLFTILILTVPPLVEASLVRMMTPLGVVDVQLFDEQAPQTVANFLNYVERGAYDGSFFHRSMPGFVLQGGGYALNNGLQAIVTDPPVMNEFSGLRSNLRGTISMAKRDGDPDSATSQWFINLADNSTNLDNQNGGFTVFGQVLDPGMRIVDQLAGLPVVNVGGVFSNLPLLSWPASGSVALADLVTISRISVLPTTTATDTERLLNYLESVYPEFIAPANGVTGETAGYVYRYYAATNSFAATKDGHLYYLGPAFDQQVIDLGELDGFLAEAIAVGY